MVTIINGNIVQEHGILRDRVLLVKQGRICNVVLRAKLASMCTDEAYNVYGGYITPGFTDMYSDHIEAMAAPRPSSIMDMELTIYESERECCTHGITTMFHSVSIWEGAGASPVRRPEPARQPTDIVEKSRMQLHLAHHRSHMRLEIDSQRQFSLALDYLRQKRVHLIPFMDYTPGQGQYRNVEVYKSYVHDTRSMNEEEVAKEATRRMNSDRLILGNMQMTTRLAKAQDISIASCDDDTIEKLDMMQKFGATVSESPIILEVARETKKRGMHTVIGAPNILLGGSHSSNMNAVDVIAQDVADILCSDYYPASPLRAVFQITKKGQCLEEMVNKVTIHPARVTDIDRDYGSIEKGKKADLLIIRILPNEPPAATKVFVDGMCIVRNHYRVQLC